MLVILFISVFEYTYFCFKSVFENLLHSLPWPYFHIYTTWSQQDFFGIVAGDFSLVFGNCVGKFGQHWAIHTYGSLRYRGQVVVPQLTDLREEILQDFHCSRFVVHPSGTKMY